MFGTVLFLTALIAQATGETSAGRQGIFTFRPPTSTTTRPQILDTRPKPIRHPDFPPTYNRDALRRGIQGSVFLEVMVAADGAVSDVKVVRSLHPDLDLSSVHAAKKFRFSPARYQGHVVAAPVSLRITFTLADQNAGPTTPEANARVITLEIQGAE